MYFILSLMLLGLSASSSWAGKVPEEINYQGNLREKGVPMNKDVDAFFRITNASGSKVYWSSDAIQKVKVVYGNFSVLLKPTGVKWDDIEDPHLEVVINQEVLLPREPLRSSIYSLVSGRVADGNITAASLHPDLVATGVIPTGAVMMFKTDCPSKGWRYMSELIDPKKGGRFPMAGTPAEAKANTTGGEPTHNHGGVTSSNPDENTNYVQQGKSFLLAGYRHVHNLAGDTNIPPYIKFVFCEKL